MNFTLCCRWFHNICSNWTWVVEAILTHGYSLRSTHCREFPLFDHYLEYLVCWYRPRVQWEQWPPLPVQFQYSMFKGEFTNYLQFFLYLVFSNVHIQILKRFYNRLIERTLSIKYFITNKRTDGQRGLHKQLYCIPYLIKFDEKF